MDHLRLPPAGLTEASLNNIPLSPLCVFWKGHTHSHLTAELWLPHFYCIPFHLLPLKVCEEPRAEPGVGISHGHLPWGEENPAVLHQWVQRLACHGHLSKGLSLLLSGNSLVTLPYSAKAGLLERLGLPSLAQALLLGQYPLQPIIATQNSLISFSIEVYFCTISSSIVGHSLRQECVLNSPSPVSKWGSLTFAVPQYSVLTPISFYWTYPGPSH